MDSDYRKYRLCEYVKYEMEDDDSGECLFVIPVENNVPNMERVLYLSDTSIYIWKMLEEGKDIESIINEMQSIYEGLDEITQDVNEFINELINEGFVIANKRR